jgi:hypothetical protein
VSTTTTAPKAPPVPAPAAIDPRIKARRIAVQRDAGRRRLRRLAVLGAVLVVLFGAWGATRSALLDVDRIQVQGAAHSGTEAVVAASGLRPGLALTEWPGAIRITVVERGAVAILAGAEGVATVDEEGRVLAVDAVPPAGLPVLEGLALAGPPASMLDAPAAPLLRVAAVLAPELQARVEAVAVHLGDGGVPVDPAEVDLRLRDDGGVVRLGTPDGLAGKMASVYTMFEQVDLRGMAVMDVRVPTAPTLTRKG